MMKGLRLWLPTLALRLVVGRAKLLDAEGDAKDEKEVFKELEAIEQLRSTVGNEMKKKRKKRKKKKKSKCTDNSSCIKKYNSTLVAGGKFGGLVACGTKEHADENFGQGWWKTRSQVSPMKTATSSPGAQGDVKTCNQNLAGMKFADLYSDNDEEDVTSRKVNGNQKKPSNKSLGIPSQAEAKVSRNTEIPSTKDKGKKRKPKRPKSKVFIQEAGQATNKVEVGRDKQSHQQTEGVLEILTCSFCGKNGTQMKTCSGCKKNPYCNEVCQTKDKKNPYCNEVCQTKKKNPYCNEVCQTKDKKNPYCNEVCQTKDKKNHSIQCNFSSVDNSIPLTQKTKSQTPPLKIATSLPRPLGDAKRTTQSFVGMKFADFYSDIDEEEAISGKVNEKCTTPGMQKKPSNKSSGIPIQAEDNGSRNTEIPSTKDKGKKRKNKRPKTKVVIEESGQTEKKSEVGKGKQSHQQTNHSIQCNLGSVDHSIPPEVTQKARSQTAPMKTPTPLPGPLGDAKRTTQSFVGMKFADFYSDIDEEEEISGKVNGIQKKPSNKSLGIPSQTEDNGSIKTEISSKDKGKKKKPKRSKSKVLKEESGQTNRKAEVKQSDQQTDGAPLEILNCSFCGKKGKNMKTCSGCKKNPYCNEVCQTKDKKNHSIQCNLASVDHSIPLEVTQKARSQTAPMKTPTSLPGPSGDAKRTTQSFVGMKFADFYSDTDEEEEISRQVNEKCIAPGNQKKLSNKSFGIPSQAEGNGSGNTDVPSTKAKSKKKKSKRSKSNILKEEAGQTNSKSEVGRDKQSHQQTEGALEILTCSFCGKKGTQMKTCGGCKKNPYCNEVCQTKDSKNHSIQCKRCQRFEQAVNKIPSAAICPGVDVNPLALAFDQKFVGGAPHSILLEITQSNILPLALSLMTVDFTGRKIFISSSLPMNTPYRKVNMDTNSAVTVPLFTCLAPGNFILVFDPEWNELFHGVLNIKLHDANGFYIVFDECLST